MLEANFHAYVMSFRCLRHVMRNFGTYVKWNIWTSDEKNYSVVIRQFPSSARTLLIVLLARSGVICSTNHVTPFGAVHQSMSRKLGPPAVREDHAGSLSHFTHLVTVIGDRDVIWTSVGNRQWRDGPWNHKASRRYGTSTVRSSFACVHHEELGQVVGQHRKLSPSSWGASEPVARQVPPS